MASSVLRLCSAYLKTPPIARNFSAMKVVSTDDESTIIAWHPKPDFPYECSKPLPGDQNQKSMDDSFLKTQLTDELLSVIKKKTPDQARQELMNITHTTKHRWFPRPRDRKAKKTPMDREFL